MTPTTTSTARLNNGVERGSAPEASYRYQVQRRSQSGAGVEDDAAIMRLSEGRKIQRLGRSE